jgi:lysophospholipase L1-like esterase
MKITVAVTALLTALILLPAWPLKAQAPAPATGTAPANNALKIANGQSIAFLGDSITQFGWQYPGGYVKQVIAGFKSIGLTITPYPAGVSGNTSRDMLARLQRNVLDRKPTWMTLSCGVNDVWHGVKGVYLETYKKNITSIVDQAQAAGIKVMILTATPIMENENDLNKKLVDYNDFLRQLAKERNLPLVDLNAIFWEKLKAHPPAPGTTLLTVDGVHPNPEGYFLFASNILKAFGVTPEQIAAYEAQWRASDDAAGAVGGMGTANAALVSPDVYKNYCGAVQSQKLSPIQLDIQLINQALCTVLKAHEQEPDFSPTLTPNSISPEMNKVFTDLLNALPPAPPGTTVPSPPASPASVAPAPAVTTTSNTSTPGQVPPEQIRITASTYFLTPAPVSLAIYQNILNTAKARKLRMIEVTNQIYFQAVRNVVKAHPEFTTMTFIQFVSDFTPAVNQEYDNLLKALPPAPPPEAPAAPTAK